MNVSILDKLLSKKDLHRALWTCLSPDAVKLLIDCVRITGDTYTMESTYDKAILIHLVLSDLSYSISVFAFRRARKELEREGFLRATYWPSNNKKMRDWRSLVL